MEMEEYVKDRKHNGNKEEENSITAKAALACHSAIRKSTTFVEINVDVDEERGCNSRVITSPWLTDSRGPRSCGGHGALSQQR